MEPAYKLTLLMPCLNEAPTIAECVTRALESLKELDLQGECLIADNGSTDGSVELAEKSGARVIKVPARGYGHALIAGINAAVGDYIILGDSDMTYDFSASSLRKYIEAMDAGADLVIGNRFAGGIEPQAMPWLHRYIGTPMMSLAVNCLFGTALHDINCGLRGCKKEKITQLEFKSGGMEFASEMIVRAAKAKLRIEEVPTTLSKTKYDRRPHLRSFRDGYRHLRLWIQLWVS